MAEENKKIWGYEKFDEEKGKIKYCPLNDLDGKETGRIIYGLKAWLDENPEERIRLGWVKHIRLEKPSKAVEYNHQTQYLVTTTRQIDDYTVEDEYHVMDKSEEMMRLEELTGYRDSLESVDVDSGIIFF